MITTANQQHHPELYRHLCQLGVRASREWLQQCKQYILATNSVIANAHHVLATKIFEEYLLADLCLITPKEGQDGLGGAELPGDQTLSIHDKVLFGNGIRSAKATYSNGGGANNIGGVGPSRETGGAILQVLDIQDISTSCFKLLELCEALGTKSEADALGTEQQEQEQQRQNVSRGLPRGTCLLELTDGISKIKAVEIAPVPGISLEMKLGTKIRLQGVRVRHGMMKISPSNATVLGGEVAMMNLYPRRLVIMNQVKAKLGLPQDKLPTIASLGSSNADHMPPAVLGSATSAPVAGTVSVPTPNFCGQRRTTLSTGNGPATQVAQTNATVSNAWSTTAAYVQDSDRIPNPFNSDARSRFENRTKDGTGNTASLALTVSDDDYDISNDQYEEMFRANNSTNVDHDSGENQEAWDAMSNFSIELNDAHDCDSRGGEDKRRLEEELEAQEWEQRQEYGQPHHPRQQRSRERQHSLGQEDEEMAYMLEIEQQEREQQHQQQRQMNFLHQSSKPADPVQSFSPPSIASRPPARRSLTRPSPRTVPSKSIEIKDEKDDESENGSQVEFASGWKITSPAPKVRTPQQPFSLTKLVSFNANSLNHNKEAENDQGEDDAMDVIRLLALKAAAKSAKVNSRRRSISPGHAMFKTTSDVVKQESPSPFVARGQQQSVSTSVWREEPSPQKSKQASRESSKEDENEDKHWSRHGYGQGTLSQETPKPDRPSPTTTATSETVESIGKMETSGSNTAQKFKRGIFPQEDTDSIANMEFDEFDLTTVAGRSIAKQSPIVDFATLQDPPSTTHKREWEYSNAVNTFLKKTTSASTVTPTSATENVIDLLSDEDEGKRENADESYHSAVEEISLPMPFWSSVRAATPQGLKRLRTDSDGGYSISGSVMDATPFSIRGKPSTVKTERAEEDYPKIKTETETTLLEFDMDDDLDFGGLAEFSAPKLPPLVELRTVNEHVLAGEEVRAEARIHKLGKFSLTTLSASIPISLKPVALASSPLSTDIGGDIVEAILNQSVLEHLMQISIPEFRILVRTNDTEARNAVTFLRSTLSQVEVVECLFSAGLNASTNKEKNQGSLIKELKILSRKGP